MEPVLIDPTSLESADVTTVTDVTRQVIARASRIAAAVRGQLPVPGHDACCPSRRAEFTVLVFDQGEPGRTDAGRLRTGDGFSIELVGGPYAGYTRAGYIEGGNIQVDDT